MQKYQRYLLILISCSAIVRLILSAVVELGNDEVYYRIFALFPALSYFDHPPLLSWIIHITTLGAEQAGEIAVRLSAVIIGTINTYIIYRIAGHRALSPDCQRNDRRGLFAAMLYTASIYCSVIFGTFIMPDTPLSIFWLLTIWIFIRLLPPQSSYNHSLMLLAGLLIGGAMLSKYTGAYLWGAAALYILIFNRKLLTKWSLYVAPIISLLVFLPVIIWNYQNDFISFTFHENRVTTNESINWLYFGRELFGGMLYSNPFVYVLTICSLIAFWRGRRFIPSSQFALLICLSLPLILMFLTISLTRETLPHWAAPAFFALIIIAAAYLDNIYYAARWLSLSLGSVALALILSVLQINYGLLQKSNDGRDATELGVSDVTLDMYGWRQLSAKFDSLRQSDINEGVMPANAQMLSFRWDEAAHLDYYVAIPNSMKLTTLEDVIGTHFYDWISHHRGGFDRQRDAAYLLMSSRSFNPTCNIFNLLAIDPKKIDDTIHIERNGVNVYNFLLYRIKPGDPQKAE